MSLIYGENRSLKTHVSLCAERYEDIQKTFVKLEGRIDEIDRKIDGLTQEIKENRQDLANILIGAAGTILMGLIGVITTILTVV